MNYLTELTLMFELIVLQLNFCNKSILTLKNERLYEGCSGSSENCFIGHVVVGLA